VGQKIEFFGLQTIPEVLAGDNLAELIVSAAKGEMVGIKERDIIIITSKVVSKAMGLIEDLEKIVPGKKASVISKATGLSAKEVEVVLRQSKTVLGEISLKNISQKFGDEMAFARGIAPEDLKEVLNSCPFLLLTELSNGLICTNAGVDCSNVEGNKASYLPVYPDEIARQLRQEVLKLTGKKVAVLLADTEIRILRQGTADIAVGVAGIEPLRYQFGKKDRFGRPKVGGVDALADLATSAAALLFGQTDEGIPVVILRGLSYKVSDEGSGPLKYSWEMLTSGFWSGFRSSFKMKWAKLFK